MKRGRKNYLNILITYSIKGYRIPKYFILFKLTKLIGYYYEVEHLIYVIEFSNYPQYERSNKNKTEY